MAEPLDILDERDPLGVPLMGSVLFHVGVVLLLTLTWYWLNHRRGETLGDLNPAGGPAYAVSPVHTIPIPQRQATPNPVANHTHAAVRSAPAKQETHRTLVPHRKGIKGGSRQERDSNSRQVQKRSRAPATSTAIPNTCTR